MTGSEGACCGSIIDVRNLNAAGISESESEPKLHAETQSGVPTVYVPGNQDSCWDRGEKCYTIAARHGIRLLMDDVVTIGGTLWTDFRLGATTLSQAMRSAPGREGMVDYRRIELGEILALHRRTRAFLDAALAESHNGPTVVVTHHAPHAVSLNAPRADLRGCYASDLCDLIHVRRPSLWVYEHVHRTADYRIGTPRSSVTRGATTTRLASSNRPSSSASRDGITSPARERLGDFGPIGIDLAKTDRLRRGIDQPRRG